MAYHQRLSLLIFIDSLFIVTTIFLSNLLVYDRHLILSSTLIITAITLLVCHHVFSFHFKLYKKAWEYASIGELIIILKIVTFSIVIAAVVQQMLGQGVFLRLLATTWMLHMIFIGGSRFWWRIVRDTYIKKNENRKRTLIIGAGAAGTMVARQLQTSNEAELLAVAFIDDDERKHHLDILSIPVVGGIDQIEKAVHDLRIDNIVIAIPSLSKRELNEIFQECAKTKAKTKILPMLEDLVTGKVSVKQFRDVQVEDLLGREPVELDIESISEYVSNKVVLVTGAGGSIGSEICRQVSQFHPKKLILLGHGENSIYSIEMELRGIHKESNIQIVTEIADIQDFNKMISIMEKYHPDVVYHAAAHKHVPLMERNPEEAVKNNMIGTKNVALAAEWNDVKTFVMISSDKAVNPTSVMGATKRLAEMIIQDMGRTSKTKFIAVRFGNVLGSRGSVIPLFKKQIQKGGPVTVTHPDMVRYFMTIPEASRLVIQAGSLARGGETFVLDMGDPVKIVDLAKNLIKLSGNSVDEIGIKFTGMRPGEKLFEELLNENEVHHKQVFPKIYIGKTANMFMEEIDEIIRTYMIQEKEALASTLVALANRKESEMIRMEEKPLPIPG
ncbi:polysaccharide biosynthesis protein [Alkalihalobacillus sp. MEB130]|uniref:polysaccharide biosynthesis protein n=1 Tax=Alkalihalobacillus sp. MEB130 TaxID=2976704 RepID=UPI0028DD44BA|nr:nucleoside-diphosphate sugar epimerase/dehydratase [Alkalihalobacillus sp. MEB130]MDT8861110.1 polysaccharide biosynthesis protein [Alkalihalobacillus sp. MEB130]